jgi:hypothetical protein
MHAIRRVTEKESLTLAGHGSPLHSSPLREERSNTMISQLRLLTELALDAANEEGKSVTYIRQLQNALTQECALLLPVILSEIEGRSE